MHRIGKVLGYAFVSGCRQYARNQKYNQGGSPRYRQEIKPIMSPLEEQADLIGQKMATIQYNIEASFLPPGWYDGLVALEREERGEMARDGLVGNQFFIEGTEEG